MSEKSKIAEAIRQIVGVAPGDAIVATVVSVQEFSCTVKTVLNAVEIPNVRLNSAQDPAKGIIIKPAVNSVVLIEAISAVDYYVAMFSEVASFSLKIGSISLELSDNEITLNGGAAGSNLTKLPALISKLNAIENDLNTLKTILAAWIPLPGDGGGVLKTALAAYYGSTIVPSTEQELKDTKVKH